MDFDFVSTWKNLSIRQSLHQVLSLCLVVGTAYMMWKGAGVILDTESPIVVVLTESMEPAFHRGDLLFLAMTSKRMESMDIPVFKLEGKEIPIVHRAIKTHQQEDGKLYVLTKGDHNQIDDRLLYNDKQEWLHNEHFMGRVYGYFPYMGMLTIWINDYPILKVALIEDVKFGVINPVSYCLRTVMIYVGNKENLSTEIASVIVKKSKEAIAKRGQFVVAFSGGSLPEIVAKGLLALQDLDCSKWIILYADERVVPLTDPDSNHKLVNDVFLSKLKGKQATVFPITSMDTVDAALEYEKEIEKSFMPVDLALLGMGPDGHTCSLFPGHALLKSDRLIDYITDSPKPPSSRITFTFKMLNEHCEGVLFVVTGSSKKDVLKEVFVDCKMKYPVEFVKAKEAVWYLDNDAAALLPKERVAVLQ